MSRPAHRWTPVCEPPRTLVRPVRLDARGVAGPTPGQARGPGWRRVARGLFVPSAVGDDLVEQRVLERSMLLGGSGAVTGWAALRLAGAAFFDGLEPDGSTRRDVDLVRGPGQARRRRAGVRWCQDRLDDLEVRVRQGIRCCRSERALFDDMRRASSGRDAAVAMDMAAAADLVSVRRMWGYVDARAGWGGVDVVRQGLRLADEYSRSPAESRLRLAWVLDAGCPMPLANRAVFSREGRLLGIADLVDDAAGVVGEYDGGDHARARQRSRDAERDSVFRDHGLEVFRVTGFDAHHPDQVVARVRAAYARAAASNRRRGWTLTPPPDWEVAPTLDEQLDIQDVLRQLHAPGGP